MTKASAKPGDIGAVLVADSAQRNKRQLVKGQCADLIDIDLWHP